MAAILNSTILDSAILHKKTSLVHSDSTWWWWPSLILPCWIQPFCTKLCLKLFNLTQTHSFSPILMMAAILNSAFLHSTILHKKKLYSFILTQLDDGSLLQFWPSWIQPFCTKLWLKLIQSDSYSFVSHSTWWRQPSWILPSCIQPFCTKKTSLIHSDWTWWWWPSLILPCWINHFAQNSDSN